MTGSVTGFRGSTVLPVTWTVVRNEHGDRFIEGIAYNAAIEGERRRITCSDEVWHNPDEDVFYSDEAVRWTVRELKAMRLYDTPLRFMHKTRLPVIGKVMDNFVDSKGHLHIVGRLYGNTKYGRKAIEFVDSGECHELSVGYPLARNAKTKEVVHGKIDEISIVPEAHFRGCKVSIKAGRSGQLAEPVKPREAPYTIFRAVRAGESEREEGGKKERVLSCNTQLPQRFNWRNNLGRGPTPRIHHDRRSPRRYHHYAHDPWSVGRSDSQGPWLCWCPSSPGRCRGSHAQDHDATERRAGGNEGEEQEV